MTKADLILKTIVSDIHAANHQNVVDTSIDRILQKFSDVDLPRSDKTKEGSNLYYSLMYQRLRFDPLLFSAASYFW